MSNLACAPENIVTYRSKDGDTISSFEEPSISEISHIKKIANQWPARKDFEIIYRERLDENIAKGCFWVKIFRDPDGVISDENLAVLAETVIEKEKIHRVRLAISIPQDDEEEYKKISARMDSAVLDYLEDHEKFVKLVPETDFEAVK
jgi:hypothetical protein